ncbi:hypothetical protein TNCV_4273111 [Trichonephila clavipes]|nr:hypothetical protein TNCV_4273111 [Trichonephila clavipes]
MPKASFSLINLNPIPVHKPDSPCRGAMHVKSVEAQTSSRWSGVESPDNAHSVAFSQRSSSPRLIEDETFNDSDIINDLKNYEDGQEARFFKRG